ncbi:MULTISPECIES: hypothetical protein [unclassified Flavobacterium]|uniref:hypothetical protein n=1 Tax=unclassified Flavobacterium TaxID=196869 RepID=UPI001291F9D8|nr:MULTISPECIES: hypothetical protein [unclassified Flavobacterium]MQP53631.1 hypothetical protein [Flavobacterium sp. LMO9]MQP63555.1 hypothetical protein [Flavobacterium sp. LMO6]
MIQKNNKSNNIISSIFLGLAIIGFLILSLKYGGRSVYKSNSNDISSIYPLLAGVSLILPYLFYVLLYKRKLKHIGKIKKIRNENEFEIFILNKSKKTVMINHNTELEDNQGSVFKIKKNELLIFNNGIIFKIDKNNDIDIEDFKNQIIGLGDEYLKKYNVPNYVNWAFIIAKPNKGDITS